MTLQKAALREMMSAYIKETGTIPQNGDDVNSIMRDMMGIIPESTLDAEMDEELGYSKYDYQNKETDNSRNGHSQKTLHTNYGDMEINVPRDRKGEFEPQVVKKYQNTITRDMEEKIISMYAKGMSTGDIESHLRDLYGIDISDSTIKCGQCGSWYGSKVWHSNDKYRKIIWQCNHKFDGGTTCTTPHLTDEEIEDAFVSAVNQLLADRDSIIADIELGKSSVYVALDQEEYKNRYDSLTERYNQTNTELTDITEKIDHMELAAAALTDFQKSLRKQKDVLTEFEPQAWYSLVDYATVYAKDDIRFAFKSGAEIKA